MIITDFYKEKRPELWPELDYNIQEERKEETWEIRKNGNVSMLKM